MNEELLTADDLATKLRISANQVKRLTKAESWPHVRFSGKTIRYRSEHVDAIVALYDKQETPTRGISGQTAASRRRAS